MLALKTGYTELFKKKFILIHYSLLHYLGNEARLYRPLYYDIYVCTLVCRICQTI